MINNIAKNAAKDIKDILDRNNGLTVSEKFITNLISEHYRPMITDLKTKVEQLSIESQNYKDQYETVVSELKQLKSNYSIPVDNAELSKPKTTTVKSVERCYFCGNAPVVTDINCYCCATEKCWVYVYGRDPRAQWNNLMQMLHSRDALQIENNDLKMEIAKRDVEASALYTNLDTLKEGVCRFKDAALNAVRSNDDRLFKQFEAALKELNELIGARRVVISVSGGVAYCDECPDDVEVVINDYDIIT